MVSGEVFAGKIVSKKLMMKHNQKEKMTQEITIHRSLNHKNVVGFHSYFDDPQNIYIVLELCKKRVRRRLVMSLSWGLSFNLFLFLFFPPTVDDGTAQAS